MSYTPAAGDFKADGSVDMTGEFRTDVGTFDSDVANGSSAVAFRFDTAVNYTTTGADLAQWRNAGVEKVSISKDGHIRAFLGTAATPGYSFTNYEDSGMFYNTSNGLYFSVDGISHIEMGGGNVRLLANYFNGNGGTFSGLRYTVSNEVSNFTTSSSNSGTTITNAGAVAVRTFTLGSASAGQRISFIDNNDDYKLIIKPGTADNIIWTDGTVVTQATGSLESTWQYDSVELLAVNTTSWVVLHSTGTWTVTA